MKYTEDRDRSEFFAEYLIDQQTTVREVAKRFEISKSTVHKDITTRLRIVNPLLFKQAKKVLDKNKAERHIRGGEATKRKYNQIKS